METSAFIFGMLTMVGFIFLISIVVGLVKISRLVSVTTHMERKLQEHHDEMDVRTDKLYETFYRKIDEVVYELNRQIEQVHRGVEGHIENVERELDNTRSSLHRDIESVHREDLSYIDSRVDKLEAKFSGTLEGSKKLLRG